jgi:hypothetical protein
MADPLTAALGRLALTARPSAAEGTHPLVAIFDPLLASTRALDGVDLCSLGCVCRGLGDRVRQFWADAEAKPGMQRQFLSVEEVEDELELVELFFRDDDESFSGGGGGSNEETAIVYRRESRVDSRTDPCDSCGRRYIGPETITYPYPFDGGDKFSLCRGCFAAAKKDVAPHHSRAERFRMKA